MGIDTDNHLLTTADQVLLSSYLNTHTNLKSNLWSFHSRFNEINNKIYYKCLYMLDN